MGVVVLREAAPEAWRDRVKAAGLADERPYLR